jgi:hypothetical protein
MNVITEVITATVTKILLFVYPGIITFISSVKKVSLPNLKRPSYGGTNILSGGNKKVNYPCNRPWRPIGL